MHRRKAETFYPNWGEVIIMHQVEKVTILCQSISEIMLKGYKDKTCCNAKDCKQNNALCESEFSTLFLCIVSKMLTMALKAVPHSLPTKSSPIHKPCCKESEADKPLSGHRQLQALALSLLLQGTRMFLMFNKRQTT